MRIRSIGHALAAVIAFVSSSLAVTPRASSGDAFHLRLTRSEPAASDTLAAPPSVVRIWFSEQPQLALTRITLVGERGDTIALARLTHAKGVANPVVAAITGRVVPGRHSVSWRTASADGHAQSGAFSFVVARPRADARVR